MKTLLAALLLSTSMFACVADLGTDSDENNIEANDPTTTPDKPRLTSATPDVASHGTPTPSSGPNKPSTSNLCFDDDDCPGDYRACVDHRCVTKDPLPPICGQPCPTLSSGHIIMVCPPPGQQCDGSPSSHN